MKLISRYIMREIAVPAVLAVVVISFVAVAGELRERMRGLPAAFITLTDLGAISFYLLPTLVTYVFPVTYLLGILLAFGRLAQNNEITAMRAAGIPLKRLVLPVIVGGGLLSAVTFVVQDQVQPWAIRRASLLISELPLRISLDTLPTGVMHDFAGLRIYIGRRDPDGALHQVDILRPDERNRPWVFYAETARLVKEGGKRRIELRNGHIIPPDEQGGVLRSTFSVWSLTLPDQEVRVPLAQRRASTLRQLFAAEGTLAQRAQSTGLREHREELRKWRVEIGDRLSFPLACLAVSIVAAPLGVRSPRGGRSWSFAVGAAVFLSYFLLRVVVEPRSLHALSVVILRGMVPNAVLGVAGMWFLWRVDRV